MPKEVQPSLAGSGRQDIEIIDGRTYELLISSSLDALKPHFVKRTLYVCRSLDTNGKNSSDSVWCIADGTMLIENQEPECLLWDTILGISSKNFFRSSGGHAGLVADCSLPLDDEI
jgi:hypothetical protein